MKGPKYTTILRAELGGLPNCVPVRILADGSDCPLHMQGESGGHFTRSGTPIRHHSAYSKKGWSNMVYHTSTREVVVGIKWLAGWMPDVFAQVTARKLRGEL